MKSGHFLKVLLISAVIGFAVGLASCSGSSGDSSSGGGTGPGEGPGHGPGGGAPGSPIMSPGQQIPLGQQVHIHESGQYPVSVQSQTTMTLECEGRVDYIYSHGGQVENGVCENQTLNIPIQASGTMQFTLQQGADMGLELHN